ncbi:Na-translocating system protein MpsC family protein [Clostridium brassicae]|uniref:Stage 0 sporulation protein A homolog n=1 Tax=Clostridium brassicae TaxID=2999072 RepID=A0ABT4DCK8_9CLOT|nr:Na-translocating system protein MpsC family protein [Clostridium brassicae]MCY6960044.1 Na-translocating system protein MpsC family protein [Clostridium brassicae]
MKNVDLIMNSIKVLYVEDEEVTRIITKKILKKIVGKIFIAKDGQEGLELFKKYKPEIVVTDLRMPILDGIDMIKNIRQFNQECGIIINTEVEDIDYILKSVDIGIDKYIVKPIEEKEIVEALRKVLFKVIQRKKANGNLYEILKIDKEDKIRIEEGVKAKVPSFIKKYTGKGPKDVKASFLGNQIEIRQYDILTSMEKILLENRNNLMLVKYYRKLFYKEIENEFVNLIQEIVGMNLEIVKIYTNPLENMEQIVFELKFNENCN